MSRTLLIARPLLALWLSSAPRLLPLAWPQKALRSTDSLAHTSTCLLPYIVSVIECYIYIYIHISPILIIWYSISEKTKLMASIGCAGHALLKNVWKASINSGIVSAWSLKYIRLIHVGSCLQPDFKYLSTQMRSDWLSHLVWDQGRPMLEYPYGSWQCRSIGAIQVSSSIPCI